MQDCTVYCQTAIVMENIGTKTGYGMAYRIGEGAMVAPVLRLAGAHDNDCPRLVARISPDFPQP